MRDTPKTRPETKTLVHSNRPQSVPMGRKYSDKIFKINKNMNGLCKSSYNDINAVREIKKVLIQDKISHTTNERTNLSLSGFSKNEKAKLETKRSNVSFTSRPSLQSIEIENIQPLSPLQTLVKKLISVGFFELEELTDLQDLADCGLQRVLGINSYQSIAVSELDQSVINNLGLRLNIGELNILYSILFNRI